MSLLMILLVRKEKYIKLKPDLSFQCIHCCFNQLGIINKLNNVLKVNFF